jgi:signal transduction histidine kinase/ActR/RegA family two-component response regulator
VANLHRGITLVVRDVDAELGAEGGAAMFNSIGIQAIVCAGLVKNDKLVAMMAVHQDRPRDWESDEIAMVEEVVERCWAHIERVRDTAKLVEQDRRKEEFIALLSHELRNPLAPLRYASALLPHVQPGSEAARDAHARIDRQVRHLGRLIDDLLDVSRINQGLIELKTQRVELLPLLAQAVDELRPGIDARHTLECDWVKGGEPLVVIGDPVRIVQMVGNLLHNATKYTPPGGRIKLAARRDGDHVVISVTDTGMGIPPEQQGGLFEMFTQLPNTAGLSQGGLGIGLAVVKRLAKLHHGDVRVVSPGAGLGTTFSINLPVVPASEQAELAQSRTAQTRPRGRRVLVVEDNEENRESLVTLLSVLGHEVDAAEDGRSGLEAASRFRPDVVLLDLGLPEIDGVEVGRRLRSDSNYDGVGLVALTGWGSAKDRQRTAEAGFDIHLTKPVDVNALEQAIVSVSERRLARRTA